MVSKLEGVYQKWEEWDEEIIPDEKIKCEQAFYAAVDEFIKSEPKLKGMSRGDFYRNAGKGYARWRRRARK
jgi:hypothetical protein